MYQKIEFVHIRKTNIDNIHVRRVRLILPAGSILGLSHAVERLLLSIPLGPANATSWR